MSNVATCVIKCARNNDAAGGIECSANQPRPRDFFSAFRPIPKGVPFELLRGVACGCKYLERRVQGDLFTARSNVALARNRIACLDLSFVVAAAADI